MGVEDLGEIQAELQAQATRQKILSPRPRPRYISSNVSDSKQAAYTRMREK